MSNGTVVENTGNQAIIRYNTEKVFVRNPRTEVGSYTNDGYTDETLAAGTLMGRVAADQSLVKLTSGASDGSQFPVGLVFEETVVAAGDTVNLTIGVAGDVDETTITFQGADTLDTLVSSRSLRDRIGSDTVGIKLVGGVEMTAYDNE